MRIILKEARTLRLCGRSRKVAVQKDEIMYVPLLKTLEQLLNKTTIFEQVITLYSVHVDAK